MLPVLTDRFDSRRVHERKPLHHAEARSLIPSPLALLDPAHAQFHCTADRRRAEARVAEPREQREARRSADVRILLHRERHERRRVVVAQVARDATEELGPRPVRLHRLHNLPRELRIERGHIEIGYDLVIPPPPPPALG